MGIQAAAGRQGPHAGGLWDPRADPGYPLPLNVLLGRLGCDTLAQSKVCRPLLTFRAAP